MGPPGWLIVGGRVGGAAVWVSPDATDFQLIEKAPGLADADGLSTVANDAVPLDGGWLLGGSVRSTAKLGADPAGTGSFGGGGGTGEASDAAKGMGAVFVAAQTDPIIGRGIARFMNLLATPMQLLADGELMTRIAEVMADPSAYPIPPREGPTRRELLAQLGHPVEPDGDLVA